MKNPSTGHSAPNEQSWLCFELELNHPTADLVSLICWETDALGCQELQEEHSVVRFYYPIWRTEIQGSIERICGDSAARIKNIRQVVVKAPPDRWMSNYREYFKGVQVAEFFIRPPWISARPATIDLQIDPSHAFGTGTHESTQLILEGLGDHVKGARDLLDVGTGSGILAIASHLVSPRAKVYAVDIDLDAVRSAVTNSARNQTQVAFAAAGPEALRGQFDVVFANLTRPLLQQNSATLLRRSRRKLVTSGFTTEEEHLVVETMLSRGGWQLGARYEKRGWVSIQFSIIE